MYYHIISECDVPLWGLSQRERIHKTMGKLDDFSERADLSSVGPNEKILLVRADYLLDANVLGKLLQQSQALLTSSSEPFPVAAWINGALLEEIYPKIKQSQVVDSFGSIEVFSPQELTGGYDPRLRKFNLSHVVRITEAEQSIIENYMYDKSYKGITDFVTKWFWPMPARWMVRKCVLWNVSPNMVTSLGWFLTILTSIAFYYGYFVLGLIMAWIMTFLDTVDGKLARVSLQSTRIGHVMDHGLDIVHPPVWYWCWAVGLQQEQMEFLGIVAPVASWFWLLLAAYIGGRMFEGLFQLLFNDISIFCWRPFDSYHRLFTARRNPCLIFLTIAMFMLDPVLGFAWIVAWTVLSTILLAVRFLAASYVRLTQGPLESWIATIDPLQPNPSLATKWFAGHQALKTIDPLIRSPM